ncbi:hypothetical protein STSP2_01196 [Anaerohalosphaera lusitana]|uniref:Uncharacterized protein n=1 Tax=Anaerohalosphaera lusitana TaxID=1936003 RepID=A0A1U9NJD4_9BACT|nr:DUF438 domain-containing protein [Anaerohalosphaera lusitana]AQT68042.1 hypothetical protein STSP2_01196 [Anaerohalosphaera lusitana]
MARTYKNSDVLTSLLRRISRGEDPKTIKSEASKLVTEVQARDIAEAEQNLINDGFSVRLAQQLASVFLLIGMLDEKSLSLRKELPADHILRMVIAEHDIMRCFIADLEDVTEEIQHLALLTDTQTEFRKFTHIIEHLDSIEEHIQREEDVIFPSLQKHGWTSLCQAARNDHVYIRIGLSDLIKLIANFNQIPFSQFRAQLNSATSFICPLLRDHFFQEETILFPIAVELIKDETVWKRIKQACDEFGYCGIHI